MVTDSAAVMSGGSPDDAADVGPLLLDGLFLV